MNETKFTADILTKVIRFQYSLRSLIFGIVVLVLTGVGLVLSVTNGLIETYSIYVALGAVWGVVMLIVSLGLFLSAIATRNHLRKQIELEGGEEALINELNNDTVLALMRTNGTGTIFTSKHIFDIGCNIIPVNTLDLAYGWTYRGVTNIQLATLANKYYGICTGISRVNGDFDKAIDTLRNIKPEILIGNSKENREIHKDRVKGYKSSH